jgi:hypothetical protein
LLDRLQNGTRRRKGGSADQSVLGRLGLAKKKKPLKDEEYFDRALRSKRKNYVFVLRRTVQSQKKIL